jgi:hypothetical protein
MLNAFIAANAMLIGVDGQFVADFGGEPASRQLPYNGAGSSGSTTLGPARDDAQDLRQP